MDAPAIGYMHTSPYITDFGKRLLRDCAARGIDCAYLGCDDIDSASGRVSATLWRDGRFVKRPVVLPPVLDNLLAPHFGIRRQSVFRYISKHAQLLNLCGASKAQFPKMLAASSFADLLIPTALTVPAGRLDAFFEVWNSVVIKPPDGTHGIGVTRIDRIEGGYALTGADGRCVRTEVLPAFDNPPQLVQPYLPFTDKSGNAADIRLLTARGEGGAWQTLAIYPRIGGNALCANIAQGGEVGELDEFLQDNHPLHAAQLKKRLYDIANRFPAEFEAYYGASVTALGIDIGIDRTDGTPYMIEVNQFPEARDFEERLAAARAALYAHILSTGATAPIDQ